MHWKARNSETSDSMIKWFLKNKHYGWVVQSPGSNSQCSCQGPHLAWWMLTPSIASLTVSISKTKPPHDFMSSLLLLPATPLEIIGFCGFSWKAYFYDTVTLRVNTHCFLLLQLRSCRINLTFNLKSYNFSTYCFFH